MVLNSKDSLSAGYGAIKICLKRAVLTCVNSKTVKCLGGVLFKSRYLLG